MCELVEQHESLELWLTLCYLCRFYGVAFFGALRQLWSIMWDEILNFLDNLVMLTLLCRTEDWTFPPYFRHRVVYIARCLFLGMSWPFFSLSICVLAFPYRTFQPCYWCGIVVAMGSRHLVCARWIGNWVWTIQPLSFEFRSAVVSSGVCR
jgi:hypothetical protein